jgi:hypothetical protein
MYTYKKKRFFTELLFEFVWIYREHEPFSQTKQSPVEPQMAQLTCDESVIKLKKKGYQIKTVLI